MSDSTDLNTLLRNLVTKVEQIDARTRDLAGDPYRGLVAQPEPKPAKNGRKPPARTAPARSIADQIIDLVQDEPRSGRELVELIGSPRSSVGQEVNKLRDQKKVFVWKEPPGRGATVYVFPRGYKDPAAWLVKKLGFEVVSG
jgi:hypothetical protein